MLIGRKLKPRAEVAQNLYISYNPLSAKYPVP